MLMNEIADCRDTGRHAIKCAIFYFSSIFISAMSMFLDPCQRSHPNDLIARTPGDNGFRIKVAGKPMVGVYRPQHVYTVSIKGTYPSQTFTNIFLVAVTRGAQDESNTIGTFQHLNPMLTSFHPHCPHVLTCTNPTSHKTEVEVLWVAPGRGTGCMEFRATVLENENVWLKDDGALTYVMCEDDDADTNPANKHHPTPSCCSCESAKYQMTFSSLWSNQAHPEFFFQDRNRMKWSNIVGSTHSSKYIMWQYGREVSDGMVHLCKEGVSNIVEDEMRLHVKDIRTIVKTAGIDWNEEFAMQQSRWSHFSVNRTHHLLSFATKMSTLGDWCAGVSMLDLCLPNCTWVESISLDLFPWDAGLDEEDVSRGSDNKNNNNFADNLFRKKDGMSYTATRVPIPNPVALLKIKRIQQRDKTSVGNTSNNATSINNNNINNVNNTSNNNNNISNVNNNNSSVCYNVLTDETADEEIATKVDEVSECQVTMWSTWSSCSCATYTNSKHIQLIKQHIINNYNSNYHNNINKSSNDNRNLANLFQVNNNNIYNANENTNWPIKSRYRSIIHKNNKNNDKKSYLDPSTNKNEENNHQIRNKDNFNFEVEDKTDVRNSNVGYNSDGREQTCNHVYVETTNYQFCHDDRIHDCLEFLDKLPEHCKEAYYAGPCLSFSSQYAFDLAVNDCVEFQYGGCAGRRNRFHSRTACLQECLHFNATKRRSDGHMRRTHKRRHHYTHDNDDDDDDYDDDDDDESRDQCKMSQWSTWSSCSASCGSRGFRTRTRSILDAAKNNDDGESRNERYNDEDVKTVNKVNKKMKSSRNSIPGKKANNNNASVHNDTDKHNPINNSNLVRRHERATTHKCHLPTFQKEKCRNLPKCCPLTEWSDWTRCSQRNCGLVGVQERSRTVRREALKRKGCNEVVDVQRRACATDC